MFSWEGQDVATAINEVTLRDPRQYRIGMLTAAPWPNGGTNGLYWFGRHPELAQFLMRVEPRKRGLEMGALISFKAHVQNVITAIEVTGMLEQHRVAFNSLSEPAFGIHWWGTLEDLKQGRGHWPQRMLQEFQGLPTTTEPSPLENRRVNALIEFLRKKHASTLTAG